MAVIQVDKKGRLVIPKEIRERLKIDESTPLILEVDDENTSNSRIHEPIFEALYFKGGPV